MPKKFTLPSFLGAYTIHTLLVFLFVSLSGFMTPNDPVLSGFINPDLSVSVSLFDKLLRWDAHWYTYLAEHGYTTFSIVFFPLLIVLIRLVAYSGLSYALAGLLICNVFAFFSFLLMEKLFRLDHSEQETNRALIFYGVFPASFFINSIYTEPLFLVFSMACIYFGRTGKWWRSGIAAALATLTRNVGILLVLYMFYESWLLYRRKKRFSFSVLSLLLPPLGLSLFGIYNYLLTGNPLAFVSSQGLWSRSISFPWDNIFVSFKQLLSGALFPNFPDLALTLLCFISLLAATFVPRYKVHYSFLLTGWAWFLIPLCSTTSFLPLCSVSRYMIVILPLYSFLSRISKPLFYGFLILSTSLLFMCTLWFVNWYFIA